MPARECLEVGHLQCAHDACHLVSGGVVGGARLLVGGAGRTNTIMYSSPNEAEFGKSRRSATLKTRADQSARGMSATILAKKYGSVGIPAAVSVCTRPSALVTSDAQQQRVARPPPRIPRQNTTRSAPNVAMLAETPASAQQRTHSK
jgi:hypothetical protein